MDIPSFQPQPKYPSTESVSVIKAPTCAVKCAALNRIGTDAYFKCVGDCLRAGGQASGATYANGSSSGAPASSTATTVVGVSKSGQQTSSTSDKTVVGASASGKTTYPSADSASIKAPSGTSATTVAGGGILPTFDATTKAPQDSSKSNGVLGSKLSAASPGLDAGLSPQPTPEPASSATKNVLIFAGIGAAAVIAAVLIFRR